MTAAGPGVDRTTAQRELRDLREQLAASTQILAALGRSGTDPDSVLDAIVERAAALCRADVAQLYLVRGDRFDVSRISGAAPQGFVDYVREHPLMVSRSSLLGRVVLDRRTQQIPDVLADPGYGRHDLQRLAGYRTLMTAPMCVDEEVVGVLSLWRLEVDPFDERAAEVMEAFAGQAALAVLNARLFSDLERSRAELEVASRHKSEFLASMSHELRTPLNAVIGFSEVLLDQLFGEVNDRQAEYLRDIRSSGQHLLELLNEILDLSKVEAGKMQLESQPFDVASVLEQSLALLRQRATSHDITLELEVSQGVGAVVADELRFKQVVLNLLTNAVKFTPDGGVITVAAHQAGEELQVTVTDTGVGVPPEDRERIFESFQQGGRGAPKEEGTGLGLTLSRRIVELFGGRMWLESEVGVGSTFGFTVTVGAPAPAPAPSERQRPPRTEGAGWPVVLIADDDPRSAELLSAYLDDSPVEVRRCQDGEGALDAAHRDPPAVLLLDVRLPALNGWEVLRALKADATTAHVPVVLVTVVDEPRRGLAMGASGYLLKPVTREELLDALRRVGVLERVPSKAPELR